MTSNRYQINKSNFIVEILDDGIPMHYSTIVNRLNEQDETITRQQERIHSLMKYNLECDDKVKDTLQKHYKLYTNMAVELRHDKYSNGACHTVLEVLEEIADELEIDITSSDYDEHWE